MKKTEITLPEIALIAGTRGILGAGLGLLMSERLSEAQRKAIGWSLFLVGAISTIPLAFEVLGRTYSSASTREAMQEPSEEPPRRGRRSRFTAESGAGV